MFKTKIKSFFLGLIFLSLGFLIINHFFEGFNFVENVYADNGGDSSGSQSGTESFIQLLEKGLMALYALMRPILAVAGGSLNNSLVYGEIFNLDIALWEFWNMLKNFANFALGFIFLLSILFYFFNYKQDGYSPKKVLPKLVIAAVGIQASWFIVALLIDLSTVLVYAFGGLPLSVLDEDSSANKMVKHHSYLNLSTMGQGGGGDSGNGGDSGDGSSSSSSGPDVLNYVKNKSNNKYYLPCKLKAGSSEVANIPESWREALKNAGIVKTKKAVSKEKCLPSPFANNLVKVESGAKLSELEPTNTKLAKRNISDLQSSMLASPGGGTGPLSTMYGSILGLTNLSVSGNADQSATGVSIEFLIKIIIAIGIIAPLLVLAVVLIVRLVVLWLVIGFSPIIVLSEVFGFGIGGEKASLKSILGMIFLPVTTVFALSISIVFLTLLLNGGPSSGGDGKNSSKLEEAIGIEECDVNEGVAANVPKGKEKNATCKKFNGVEILWKKPDQASGFSYLLDSFNYIVINFFGIALMWTVVFAAMKTSKITNNMVSSIQTFGQDMLKTAPVLPAPGGPVGVGAYGEGLGRARSIPKQKQSTQFGEKIQPGLQKFQANMSGKDDQIQQKINEISSNSSLSGTEKLKQTLSTVGDSRHYNFSDFGGASQIVSDVTGYNSLEEAIKDPTVASKLREAGITEEDIKGAINYGGSNYVEKEQTRWSKTYTSSYKKAWWSNPVQKSDDKFYSVTKTDSGQYVLMNAASDDPDGGDITLLFGPEDTLEKSHVVDIANKLQYLDTEEIADLLNNIVDASKTSDSSMEITMDDNTFTLNKDTSTGEWSTAQHKNNP